MMKDLLQIVRAAEERYSGLRHHPITIEVIDTDTGALDRTGAYLTEKGWKLIGWVSDQTIYDKYGDRVKEVWLGHGIEAELCLVKPDEHGDVIADERAIVQVLTDITLSVDAYVVLGSGTLHDIVRFSASRTNKPFISVPTAPSVDGFTSAGAPILLRGFKQTIQTIAPIAVFADLELYSSAPRSLVAAGFGDMLGKHTSLFDWKFSHVTGNEPYSQAVADLTRQALEWCEDAQDDIAAGKPEGLRVLMEALILSGLSMLLLGASHPASGAEHHLSHDWEMELLRRGSRQVLHGAKVGIACAIIADKYAEWSQLVHAIGNDDLTAALLQVPGSEELLSRLKAVGGPTDPSELGIHDELVEASLLRAHKHRLNRHTLLKRHNEMK